jgi:purine nucleosidase
MPLKAHRLIPAWILLAAAGALAGQPPIPVILDTDIGTDVDDAYALVLAARHPRLDLRGVVTWNGQSRRRAHIARKLLMLMGREDVPVAAGMDEAMSGKPGFWGGWEGKGLLEEGEIVGGVSERSGGQLIVDLVRGADQKVTIVAVGGVNNLAAALNLDSSISSKIERLVIMGGNVRPLVLDGVRLPERSEVNLHNDVKAAQIVLQAGIPVRLAPAEVTYHTLLSHADFERIEQADPPLARSIAAMTRIWEPLMKKYMALQGVTRHYQNGVAMLHDPLAVFSLTEPDGVTMERVRIRLEIGSDAIRTVEDPRGPLEVELITAVDHARLSRAVADAVLHERVER